MIRQWSAWLAAGLGAVVSLASAPPVGADCLSMPIDVPRSFREAAVVFAGTVVDGNADRLTLRPDRVWKGPSSGQVTIHLRGRPGSESYRFRTGERLLVFARIVGPDDDPDDLPEGALAMPRGCASPPWPLTLSSQLDEIAPPRVVR
jgi:hypothetical protein